jgi:hypothetical protein
MRMLHILGMVLFLFASPASGKTAAAWVVAQKSGDVQVVRNGAQPASIQLHSALAPGDLVATGASGRAMLTNGDDYVIVAPSSRLVLPREQQQTGFTRLIQQVGTMLYKVKHTGVPHFSVDTPMLAAVVKGTSFTIVVDQNRSAVQVTDGIVEVSSSNGFARRLVERGATVYVGRERPNEIIELKSGVELPAPTSSDDGVRIESSGDVPLSTVSDLTGGLVREMPTAPVATAVNIPVTNIAAQTMAQATDSLSGAPIIAAADVSTPSLTTPSITSPVVAVGQVTVPEVGVDLSTTLTPPVITTASITTPTVTTSLSTTPISTPTVTTPIATVTPVTVSPVTVSSVTVPTVSVTPTTITTSPITTPTVSTPTVSTPTVTTPIASVTPVTVPTVTVPTVTVAPVTVTPTTIATPTVTVPTISTPAITTPTVTTPIVTIPSVTVPAVTLPPITIPSLGIGLPKGP